MKWQADQQVQTGVDEQGLLPTEPDGQAFRERPKHGAGEAASEGDRRYRAAIVGIVERGENRKRRLIQSERHRGTGQGPAHVENHQRGRPGDPRQRHCRGKRSDRHRHPSAPALDEFPRGKSAKAGDEDTNRKGPDHLRLAPTMTRPDGGEKHGERIIKRSPRDRLGQTQNCDGLLDQQQPPAWVLHTPVSGSMRLTFSAAPTSPARAATIERTCS